MIGEYHHRLLIRGYRKAASMSVQELARRWNTNGGVGVRYVVDVEAGKRHITDSGTLRRVAQVLQIPLWKLGLSEYDPFTQTLTINDAFLPATLEVAQNEIQNIWITRK